jgi:hypothetical protein
MCGGYIYSRFGLKITYYLSFTLSLVGGTGIMILEWIHKVHLTQGTLTPEYSIMFHSRMPSCIFMCKFGVAMAFLSSYYASFTDNRIFSNEKRATAIGICNFVGRGLTGLSPIINELNEPVPMAFFLAINIVALFNTTTINLK